MDMNASTDQAGTQSVEDRLADKLWGPAEGNAAPEQDAAPAEEAEIDQADDQADDTEEEVVQQSSAVDEVEVEHDGWKGKVPAKLKAELDKAADYTRKTQEVAEQRRLIEASQRAQQEQTAFQQAAAQEFRQLQQIEAQLEQYRTVDLSTVDGDTLQRMSMAAANLREERARLQEQLGSKRTEFKQRVMQSWADMTKQAREVIVKTIPNWDGDAPHVAKFALDQGFPFEFITGYDRESREPVGPGIVDPTFAKTLHMAWKYSQLQQGKPAATQKASKAPPVLKPGAVDNRSMKQVEHMNFRKAIKNAGSDTRKAELIGDRLGRKFNF
jgi:hypothetical protein